MTLNGVYHEFSQKTSWLVQIKLSRMNKTMPGLNIIIVEWLWFLVSFGDFDSASDYHSGNYGQSHGLVCH